MAADSTLVRGAYAAAGGGIKDFGLAASKGMTKIGDAIGESVTEELQERKDYFDSFAEWELTRTPGMNEAETEAKATELMEMKNQYMFGDNLSRAQVMRHMGDMKAQQDELDAAKKAFAKSAKNKNTGLGANNEFKESDYAQKLLEQFTQSPTTRDGVSGYLITHDDGTEEFVNANKIYDLIKENEFDQQSSDVINNLANIMIERSDAVGKTAGGEAVPFDWDNTYRRVQNEFVGKGTIRSLAKDDIIPGMNFYDDLIGHLQEGTYGALDIDQNMVEEFNAQLSPEDGITYEDAEAITDALLKDDKTARHYLSFYYTQFLKTQWDGRQNQYSTFDFKAPWSTENWLKSTYPKQEFKGKIIKGAGGKLIWSE